MPRHITLRIDDELDAQISELAAELGLSRSQVVRNAITAGVAEGRVVARRLRSPAIRGLVRALLAIDGDPQQIELFERVLSSGAVPQVEPRG